MMLEGIGILYPMILSREQYKDRDELMKKAMMVRDYTYELLKKHESKEVFKIQLPKAYLWVGAISTLIFTGMFIYTVVAPNETATVFAGVGFSVFLVLVLSMISACYKWNILLYKDHIAYTTFLGRSYKYDYSRIKGLKIAQSVLILKTENKTFYIDRYAIGLDMLLRAFEENNIEIK